MKKKNNKMSAEEKAYIARKESFQEHLPIADIDKTLLVDKEGNYYPIFEIGEKNIALMDTNGLLQLIGQCESIFEALDLQKSQFLSVSIPFDIEPYVKYQRKIYTTLLQKSKELQGAIDDFKGDDMDRYNALRREADQVGKYMLYIDNQTKFVEGRLHGAEIINKKSFFIPKIKDSKNKIAVEEAARNIEGYLRMLSDKSHRCSQQDIQDVLFNILNAGSHTTYHAADKQYSPTLDFSNL